VEEKRMRRREWREENEEKRKKWKGKF